MSCLQKAWPAGDAENSKPLLLRMLIKGDKTAGMKHDGVPVPVIDSDSDDEDGSEGRTVLPSISFVRGALPSRVVRAPVAYALSVLFGLPPAIFFLLLLHLHHPC